MVGSKIVEILTAFNAKKEGVLRQERVISQTMSVLSKNKMDGWRTKDSILAQLLEEGVQAH